LAIAASQKYECHKVIISRNVMALIRRLFILFIEKMASHPSRVIGIRITKKLKATPWIMLSIVRNIPEKELEMLFLIHSLSVCFITGLYIAILLIPWVIEITKLI